MNGRSGNRSKLVVHLERFSKASFELTAGEEVVALESYLGASPCHVAVFILLAIVLSQHLCKACSPYVQVHVVTLINEWPWKHESH